MHVTRGNKSIYWSTYFDVPSALVLRTPHDLTRIQKSCVRIHPLYMILGLPPIAYRGSVSDQCRYWYYCRPWHRLFAMQLDSGNLAPSRWRHQWAAPGLGRCVLSPTRIAATMLGVWIGRGSARRTTSRLATSAPSTLLKPPCGMLTSRISKLGTVCSLMWSRFKLGCWQFQFSQTKILFYYNGFRRRNVGLLM